MKTPLDSRFALSQDFLDALNARGSWEQARVLDDCVSTARLSNELEAQALLIAEDLGWRAGSKPGGQLCDGPPALISGIDELSRSYVNGFKEGRIVLTQKEEAECQRQKITQVDASIARNDWRSLGLPSPSEVIATLVAGGDVWIEGHHLDFDEDLDVTWMETPYVDSMGWSGLIDEQACLNFLRNIACGKVYGRQP